MDMEVKSNIHFTSHILLNVVRKRGNPRGDKREEGDKHDK
jgi:hypothetical protein